jgi:hypothetical protein
MGESRDEPTADVAACADHQDAHYRSMGRTGERLGRPAPRIPARVTFPKTLMDDSAMWHPDQSAAGCSCHMTS